MVNRPNPYSSWLPGAVSSLGIVGATLLILLGFIGVDLTSRWWLVVAGAGALMVLGLGLILATSVSKAVSGISRLVGELRDLYQLVERHSTTLSQVAENTRISDAAKTLAHREQELDALRAVIRDDIRNQKWEAASSLIDELEKRFGYRQEADLLREELDSARRAAIQTKLAQAIDLIDRHFANHEWVRAQKEIDRLLHALPGDSKVLSLLDRLKDLKEQHKRELKGAWDEAVRRSDTDHAIDVLRELDQYLSPAEVQELHETARKVFKEKLLQLGVQFRFAVNERRWQDALLVGLELVRDFPNARMASEVREALDTLRERARATAAGTSEVEAVGR